jgi:SAM-dependent methyltransferase
VSPVVDVREYVGPIDIYWFDQIVRGRVAPGMRILDAACGSGRNLIYLLRQGYECYGLDADPQAIETVRWLAGELAPEAPPDRFRLEHIQDSTFPDGIADAVISSAILHLARSDEEFRAMLLGSWRLLAPGGLFFCRLASSIGIEGEIRPADGPERRRFDLPDGSQRYLVDAALLDDLEAELGARRLDVLKTTVVQHQRSMTTWVLRRSS